MDKTLGLILGNDFDLILDAMVDDMTREDRIQAEETDRFMNQLIDEIALEEGDLVYQACVRASQTVLDVVGVASSMIMETKKEAASYVKVVVREARRQSFKILVGDPDAEIDGAIGLKIAQEPIVIGTNTSPTNRTNRLKVGFQTVLRPTPSRGRMESFDLPLNPGIRKLVCIDAWASTEHTSIESPKPVVSIDSGHEEYVIQNWGTRPDTSTIVKSQTGSSAMTFGNNIFGDLGAPIVGGGNIFSFRTDVRKVTGVGPTTPFVDALGVGWATPLGAERERGGHDAFVFAAAGGGGSGVSVTAAYPDNEAADSLALESSVPSSCGDNGMYPMVPNSSIGEEDQKQQRRQRRQRREQNGHEEDEPQSQMTSPPPAPADRQQRQQQQRQSEVGKEPLPQLPDGGGRRLVIPRKKGMVRNYRRRDLPSKLDRLAGVAEIRETPESTPTASLAPMVAVREANHRYPQLDTTAPLTPPARPLTQTPPNAIPDRGSYAEVAGAVQGDVQVGAAAAPDVLSVTLLAPCR